MNEKLNAVIAKINHLRGLAKSSNEHEAAAAASIADRYIAQHQLSEADLVIKGATAEEINISDEYLYKTSKLAFWRHELASIICKHYGCTFYTTHLKDPNTARGTVKAFRMVGCQSDIQITQYMYAWLSDEIERLTKLNAYGRGTTVSQNYARGCVKGIKDNLDLQRQKNQRDAVASGHSAAMILLDNRFGLAEKVMYSKVKNLVSSTIRTNINRNEQAYNDGREHGREIELTKGLNNGPGPKQIK